MDLVILAAGLGSRFGGDKQIQPIDSDGNFILDYSVYDAVRAGFDRVIFIIREEHKGVFEKNVLSRMRKIVPVECAFQKIEDVPKGANIPVGRTKPWGTAHALYACRDIVSNRFAVINADDFYGFNSFKILAEFLKRSKDDEFLSIGFKVKNTLPVNGVAKRGIFKLDGNVVDELIESRVKKVNGRIFATPLKQENWQEISPETMVSMTMFGFSDKILKKIKEEAKWFFAQDAETLKTDELLLPEVVNDMRGETTHFVVPTTCTWLGMTYPEDLTVVKKEIGRLQEEGKYPRHLYNSNDKNCGK